MPGTKFTVPQTPTAQTSFLLALCSYGSMQYVVEVVKVDETKQNNSVSPHVVRHGLERGHSSTSLRGPLNKFPLHKGPVRLHNMVIFQYKNNRTLHEFFTAFIVENV